MTARVIATVVVFLGIFLFFFFLKFIWTPWIHECKKTNDAKGLGKGVLLLLSGFVMSMVCVVIGIVLANVS